MTDVALIAPVRAYRDALGAAVESGSELRIVAEGASFADAVSAIPPRRPAVALIDFAVDDLVRLLEVIRRGAPTTTLVGIGIGPCREHAEFVVRAAEAGVTGFVEADRSIDEIIEAVRLAVKGESSCSPRIAALLLAALQHRPDPRNVVAPPATAGLTPREAIVAELVASGLTNRQIASRLVVGESTVKTHVHSILMKLGVEHRTEICVTAASQSGR